MQPNDHRFRSTVADVLSPIQAIRAAMRAHPAFKYAVAALGLIAIVAVVLRFGASPATLAFGAIALLVLMVAFLVFAQAAAARRSTLSKPAAVLVWSFLTITILTAAFLFSSAFFDQPLPLRSAIFGQQVRAPQVSAPVQCTARLQVALDPAEPSQSRYTLTTFQNGVIVNQQQLEGLIPHGEAAPNEPAEAPFQNWTRFELPLELSASEAREQRLSLRFELSDTFQGRWVGVSAVSLICAGKEREAEVFGSHPYGPGGKRVYILRPSSPLELRVPLPSAPAPHLGALAPHSTNYALGDPSVFADALRARRQGDERASLRLERTSIGRHCITGELLLHDHRVALTLESLDAPERGVAGAGQWEAVLHQQRPARGEATDEESLSVASLLVAPTDQPILLGLGIDNRHCKVLGDTVLAGVMQSALDDQRIPLRISLSVVNLPQTSCFVHSDGAFELLPGLRWRETHVLGSQYEFFFTERYRNLSHLYALDESRGVELRIPLSGGAAQVRHSATDRWRNLYDVGLVRPCVLPPALGARAAS